MIPAGMGSASVLADMDFETYSEAGYVWNDDAQKWDALPGAPSGSARYGLGCVGAAVYSESPTCEVLSFAYDLKDGAGPRLWRPGLPDPRDLFDYIAAGGLVEAWNAPFERWIWYNVCMPRYRWPVLPLRQMRCAMAKARAFALPGALAKAGEVLRLVNQKDAEGARLLKKFSMPRKPTKSDPRRRIPPAFSPASRKMFELAQLFTPGSPDPDGYLIRNPATGGYFNEDANAAWLEWNRAEHDDTNALFRYNVGDIVTEAEASSRCPDLTGEELEFWLCDFEMNARGVHIDLPGVENCIVIVEAALELYNAELCALTGGAVERASEIEKLKGWLGAWGVHTASLDEDALDALLSNPDPFAVPAPARRALELRRAVGSASVKKVYSMRNQVTAAGRLHDLFQYHAARTGRVTGSGPQPTNLPREGPPVVKCVCGKYHGMHVNACPWCGLPTAPCRAPDDWCIEAAEDALSIIAHRSLALVEYFFGPALETVSGCLRCLFTADDEHEFICSDFNSIEAVCQAMISGEQWRIDVFRTHGKIYEMGAAKISGVPFEEILDYKKRTGKHHPLRQTIGKISELASGYQGWINSWKAFGADEAGLDDEQIKQGILAWRAASPAIVEIWGGQWRRSWAGMIPEMYGIEGAAVSAVLHPGRRFEVFRLDTTPAGIAFEMRGDALYLELPSGRFLTYHRPRLESQERFGITSWALSFEGYNTNPNNGPVGWIRMRTWGGRLFENICQAVARDVLRHAIVNLERAGYYVVMQVYDEIISEVVKGVGSLEEFERIMQTMPAWAKDWPIRASGGWRGKRYRKG